MRSSLDFLLASIKKLISPPDVDLSEVRKLEAHLYHDAGKSLDNILRMMRKLKDGESLEDAHGFLSRNFQKLDDEFASNRKILFQIAPKKTSVLSIYSDLAKLKKLIKNIDISKEGTQLAEKAGRMEDVSARLKSNADDIFKKQIATVYVPLAQALANAINVVKFEKETVLKENGIRIVESVDPGGGSVRISFEDYKTWVGIFGNFIRNAVEAVEKAISEPEIRMDRRNVYVKMTNAKGSGDLCEISIKDQGVGMSPEVQKSYFRRGFSQGKTAGLGLGVTEETINVISRNGSIEVKSELGKGTEFSIKVKKGDGSAVKFVSPTKRRTKQLTLLGVLSVALMLVIYFQFIYANPIPQKVVFGKDYIEILDEKDRVIRRHFLRSQMLNNALPWEVKDINGDNKREILCALTTADLSDTLNGTLFCFDNKGRVNWKRKAIDNGKCPGDDSQFGYHPALLKVVNLNGSKGNRIIVAYIADNPARQQTTFLDVNGKITGKYSHQGQIHQLITLDVDRDGENEVILAGCNNRINCGVIAILDADNISGASPPHTGEGSEFFQNSRLKRGTEKYYIMLPPTDYSLKVKPSCPNGGIALDVFNGREGVFKAGTDEGQTEGGPGLDYVFRGFRLERVSMNVGFETQYTNRRIELGLPPFNQEKYLENQLKQVRYYDGENWTAEPCINKNYITKIESPDKVKNSKR